MDQQRQIENALVSRTFHAVVNTVATTLAPLTDQPYHKIPDHLFHMFHPGADTTVAEKKCPYLNETMIQKILEREFPEVIQLLRELSDLMKSSNAASPASSVCPVAADSKLFQRAWNDLLRIIQLLHKNVTETSTCPMMRLAFLNSLDVKDRLPWLEKNFPTYAADLEAKLEQPGATCPFLEAVEKEVHDVIDDVSSTPAAAQQPSSEVESVPVQSDGPSATHNVNEKDVVDSTAKPQESESSGNVQKDPLPAAANPSCNDTLQEKEKSPSNVTLVDAASSDHKEDHTVQPASVDGGARPLLGKDCHSPTPLDLTHVASMSGMAAPGTSSPMDAQRADIEKTAKMEGDNADHNPIEERVSSPPPPSPETEDMEKEDEVAPPAGPSN